MKIILTAVNAKYIHSNLAVYTLQASAEKAGVFPEIREFTINQSKDSMLRSLFLAHADVVCVSCYIWNISIVEDLITEYHKISPETKIWLGGPEVSYHAEEMLEQYPFLDGIMKGEGEITFRELAVYYQNQENGTEGKTLEEIHGITYRDAEGAIKSNPWRPVMDLSEVDFPYANLKKFENRIIYYESSRGCPFSCSYCLSSIDKRLRFRNLDLVKKELAFFLEQKVPQVKFVDRTFNCSKEHAMAIWRYLAEHDNGVTNFHFELTAHLIDQEMIDFLSTVRQGLFQFEIGVQSTNPDTIREIRRTTDTERLLAICRQLDKPKNIHLHLDLIAGLPYEDLESFGRSFDTVMQIRPQQMQLGFLKVLKGSLMEQKAPEYGLEYSRRPPFTFIRTRWLDYPQLLQLKEMESVVEDYYNSGLFGNQIEWMLSQEVSPFSFFLDFGAWKVEHQLHLIPQGIAERCTTLWDYYFSRYPERAEQEGLLHDLCLFDLCLHTKPQKLPERVTTQANLPYREAIRALFRNEAQLRCLFGEENFFQHSRQAHLQVFSFDPQTRQPRLCAMLFDYHRRDLLGRAKVTDVSDLIL